MPRNVSRCSIEVDWDRFQNLLRLKRGEVSMRARAAELGIHMPQYHSYESGKTRPKVETFFYLCDYLGVKASELVRRRDS